MRSYILRSGWCLKISYHVQSSEFSSGGLVGGWVAGQLPHQKKKAAEGMGGGSYARTWEEH